MYEKTAERFLNIHNSSLGAAIDSDVRVSETGPEDLVNYVFQILYDTEDTDEAIRLLLEIIGKRFDVSRAYIFENTDDGKYCDNTYEWCSEGILPEKRCCSMCHMKIWIPMQTCLKKMPSFIAGTSAS